MTDSWSNSLLELQFSPNAGPAEADLMPLARVAVWTPLVDAEPALNVLADILLDRGIIKRHAIEEIVAHPSETHMHFANPPTPLESALAWARAKTGPGVLERMKREMEAFLSKVRESDGLPRLEPRPMMIVPARMLDEMGREELEWFSLNTFGRSLGELLPPPRDSSE